MHINVSHILAGDVGTSADFQLEGENPDIPDLDLTEPIRGSVTVMRLDDGVTAKGRAELSFGLECYRCLDPYQHRATLNLTGVFKRQPGEDEWPLDGAGQIDLSPLIRQEALVNIPIQQLCNQDCQGLCAECGQRLSDGHGHQSQDVGHKPRLKVQKTAAGPKKGQ